jgi:hypothetical protein
VEHEGGIGEKTQEAAGEIGTAFAGLLNFLSHELWVKVGEFAIGGLLLLAGLALAVYGAIVAVRPPGQGGLSLPRLPAAIPVPA